MNTLTVVIIVAIIATLTVALLVGHLISTHIADIKAQSAMQAAKIEHYKRRIHEQQEEIRVLEHNASMARNVAELAETRGKYLKRRVSELQRELANIKTGVVESDYDPDLDEPADGSLDWHDMDAEAVAEWEATHG